MSAATITLFILLLAAILFVTEIIPVAATALLVTFLLFLMGIIDAETVFSGFTNPIVILITGMFVIGASLFETGVAKKIGTLITRFAKTEKQLLLAVMVIGAVLSAFLSNTSTTAVLMPIVILIADSAGYSRAKLLMPLAYATALGGMITLVGTNSNLAVQGVMQNESIQPFGFFEFAKVGVPLTIIGIIYMMTIGYKLIPSRENQEKKTFAENETAAGAEVSAVHSKNTRKQVIAVAILLTTVVFMVFEQQIGVPLHIVSIMGALLIVLTRTMTEKQAYKSLDMSTIILVAGMMPMATALSETGAAKMIADTIIGSVGMDAGPYLITGLLFLLTTILTSVMSNTAAATLLAPIGLVIANSMGADPRALLMAICVGASAAYASPIGTPPNTMIYSAGNYRFVDYIKCGVPFIIIQLIVCLVMVPLFWPFYE
ncbi:SLC13 family permease [Domibacillus enclensis]|uniref:Anion transporter n=1 Tax=Domibacillus enclensis TaxID=1017273 RepID=A0A1N6N8U9_9BACI|nr:SLC13 family permease [Domibacillus enclensis]OXS79960.1 cation transporter [Domibacillus enclensis]SIP88510.1 anion transporter [Domibacillus enclensis]